MPARGREVAMDQVGKVFPRKLGYKMFSVPTSPVSVIVA